MYDYRKAIKEDIKEYIKENKEQYDFSDRDDVREELYDDMFIDDSVTGNGSGSYTFNAQEAKEYVSSDMDLLVDACEEFGSDIGKIIKDGWEACDVTIRCYLLGECLDKVLEEMDVNEELDESLEVVGGISTAGDTVMSVDQFNSFMDKVIEESK